MKGGLHICLKNEGFCFQKDVGVIKFWGSTDIDSELYMDRSEVYSRKYEVSRKYKNDKSKIYKICSIPNLSRMSIFNDLIDWVSDLIHEFCGF